MNKDFEDDFLDDLMDEVMSSPEEKEIEELEVIDKEGSVEGAKDHSDNPNDNIDNVSKPVKSGGLLGMLGKKSEPVSEDESTRKENNLKEKVEEIEEAETFKASNDDKGLPLLARLKAKKEVENEAEDKGEVVSSGEAVDYKEEPFGAPGSKVSHLFEEVERLEREEEEKYKEEIEEEEPIPFTFHRKESKAEDNSLLTSKQEKASEIVQSNSEEKEVESKSKDVDLIDNLLEGLTEEEDVSKAVTNLSLEEDVDIPLEKKGMDEIIVSRDGKTLAEALASFRKGNKGTKEKYEEILNHEDKVELNGKKFSDNRYTKHAEVIDREQAIAEERMKLSMKYLQRNAEFTEQEKVIMRNLGLSGEQLAKIMKTTKLSSKEKEEIVKLGRYGSEKVFKGKRYRTTVGDRALLEYLAKFRFANTRILRWISDESQNRTWRKLNRLRDAGLVESQTMIGIADLWGATPAGIGVTGYGYEPGMRPMPKIPTISSNMGVNYIAACLWFNTVNVLNLEDFPASNREIPHQEDGRDRVRGEMLVSEYEIRSSLGKEINPSSTTMQTLGDERLYDVIASNVREEFERWEQGGKLGESPEFSLGNEYMWVLYPTSQLTLSYHVPDLVVKRDRCPNGEPRSIAVEVERHEKSNARYDQIMLAYKLDEHLYEKVIWVTPNTRTARALEKAAKEVGFENYQILPIITKTGVYSKQDIWMI